MRKNKLVDYGKFGYIFSIPFILAFLVFSLYPILYTLLIGFTDLKGLMTTEIHVLWKEPFKIDISDALVDGNNSLEIKVTNSWGNRLIGDSALPKEERATMTSWEFYSPDDPLPTSGLIGPVSLLTFLK